MSVTLIRITFTHPLVVLHYFLLNLRFNVNCHKFQTLSHVFPAHRCAIFVAIQIVYTGKWRQFHTLCCYYLSTVYVLNANKSTGVTITLSHMTHIDQPITYTTVLMVVQGPIYQMGPLWPTTEPKILLLNKQADLFVCSQIKVKVTLISGILLLWQKKNEFAQGTLWQPNNTVPPDSGLCNQSKI